MNARRNGARIGWSLDPTLVAPWALLLVLGLVMVASASITVADRELGDPFHYLERQAAYALFGLGAAAVVAVIPLRLWEKAGPILLVAALFLLVAVLIPGVGYEVNGSRRWLRFGPIGMQASEPARLLILMYLAGHLLRYQDQVRTTFSGFIRPVVLVCLACVLLLAEPDFGAATVLVVTTLGLMFVVGVRLRDFLWLFLGVTAAIGALAVSSAYRLKRLTAFLDPWADPFDSGFQLTQSLIAIGRGEWFGVGLGSSVQKLFYLPEAHTDFLFAVLAEELGLVGVAVTLALFTVIVWRALALASQATQQGLGYHANLACALGLCLGLQALINIGVNMGLLPTKGLTLPLLSYGGSSLVVTLTALGLLVRIEHETRLAGRSAVPRRRGTR